MFRHKDHMAEEGKKITDVPVVEEGVSKSSSAKAAKDVSPEALRELLEKDLKWSQIIYEQNRRLNSKLFWLALSGWVRVLIIVVPLILAVIYLPPFLTGAWKQYQNLVGTVGATPKDLASPTLEKILKLLPIDPAKQEQVKTILK